jgi:hypothetical protein
MANVVILLFTCGVAGVLAGVLIFYGADRQQDLRSERAGKETSGKRYRDSATMSGLLALFLTIGARFLGVTVGESDRPDAPGEYAGIGLGAVIITMGCFFIIRRDPRSLWYVPVIANAIFIFAAFVDPNFIQTPLWIPVCGGWLLCLAVSLFAARLGKRHALLI